MTDGALHRMANFGEIRFMQRPKSNASGFFHNRTNTASTDHKLGHAFIKKSRRLILEIRPSGVPAAAIRHSTLNAAIANPSIFTL